MGDLFHDVLFPEDIGYGSTGGPGFLTRILILGSGHEQRSKGWSQARAEYNVIYGIKGKAELDALRAFHYCRYGKTYSFPLKDHEDYSVTGQAVGTSDGETATYDLVKTYTDGTYTYDRVNIMPVVATVVIYFDDVEQESGWSVAREAAQVTLDPIPDEGVVITADFEFHVPVRFDIDKLPRSIEEMELGDMGEIPLIEVRVK